MKRKRGEDIKVEAFKLGDIKPVKLILLHKFSTFLTQPSINHFFILQREEVGREQGAGSGQKMGELECISFTPTQATIPFPGTFSGEVTHTYNTMSHKPTTTCVPQIVVASHRQAH